MLKEQDIKNFLESRSVTYKDKSSLWGILFPSKATYLLGPVATALSMQYHVLHFSDGGVAIIGISNTTGKIMEEAFLFVPREEIKSIRFHKKMLAYELEIETFKGILAYKVNKVMVGASWHKDNLTEVLGRFV